MQLGHNQPPSMIDTAGEVTASLNNWMRDHPAVETEEAARDAKVLLDRGKLCLKDQEDERDGKVRPLNEQIRTINQHYRPSKDLLTKVLHELTRRVTDFLAKEQAKRIKEAEAARQKAEETEKIAREAEQREQEAIDDARHGVEVDIAEASRNADASFTEYRKAEREADRLNRTKVRVGGGFTRALSLRNKEILRVVEAVSAINAIGLTPDIEAAIIKGARAYRTLHQELPPGIESKTEQTA